MYITLILERHAIALDSITSTTSTNWRYTDWGARTHEIKLSEKNQDRVIVTRSKVNAWNSNIYNTPVHVHVLVTCKEDSPPTLLEEFESLLFRVIMFTANSRANLFVDQCLFVLWKQRALLVFNITTTQNT